MAQGTIQAIDPRELGRAAGAPVPMRVVYQDTFQVGEDTGDVDTMLDLQQGDMVEFSASGSIWAGVWFTGRNGPEGWNNIDHDRKFPLPGTHPYALLGKLDGRYFYIGTGFKRVYQGPGSRLYLRVNDDTIANGNGAFQCSVVVWRHV